MGDNRSSADLSQDIANKEKELSQLLDNQQTIEQEILLFQRQILDLQGKKKDLEIDNGKAKHLIRKMNIEIKILTKRFWSVRNSGL